MHLALALLGGFQAELDNQALTHFASNKVRALLAYLAVESSRAHPRESLAALLWPDYPEQTALTNLRVALADLRGQLRDSQAKPPFLLIQRGSIQFNRASEAALDVWEFEQAYETCLQIVEPDSLEEPCANLLDFRPFLEGFSIPDSGPFEEWLRLKREQLTQQALRLLRQRADIFESSGAYEEALRYARKQVEIEPWAEEAHRQIMRLLALSGQASAALAQYEACKRALADGLDVEPAAETRRVYELVRAGSLDELRRGELAPYPGEPPYKGLQFFDVTDIPLFFGREKLTGRLLERVLERAGQAGASQPPVFTITGASGSGKSSLVRAGLVPALRDNGYDALVITPGAHPLIPRAGTAKSILVIDQFEELFTLCHAEDERQAFLDDLLAGTGWAGVILVLRADFYGHCARYPGLRETISRQQEYIGAMDESEIRRAIEDPARKAGWDFEPGLADLILRDVGASDKRPPEPGALPLLSHALLETWKRRRGKTLTLEGYNKSGGVRGAIARTAESVLEQFSPEEQRIARQIFIRLTELGNDQSDSTAHDTRRRVQRSELAAIPAKSARYENLLHTLAEARLVTLSAETVEVAHEALIREWPALRQWLSENRDGLRLHRHITESAQAWERLGLDPGELYRGARLAQALEWAAQEENQAQLNFLEEEFLNASRARAEQETAEREAQHLRELQAAQRLAQSQRQRSLFLTAGLIAAILLLGLAGWQFIQANTNLRSSEAQRLAAEANRLLVEGKNSETAALLALRSLNLQYSFQGDEALGWASRKIYPIQTFRGHTGAARGVVFTHGGSQIITNSMDNTVRVWDTASGEMLRQYEGQDGAAVWIDSTPDGSIVAGNAANQIFVWDGANGEVLLVIDGTDAGGLASNAIDLSTDGKTLLVGHLDGSARIWDVASGSVLKEFPGHINGPTAVAFSPDEKQVLTADTTGMRLWDAASGKVLLSFSGHQDLVMGLAFSPDGRQILTASWDKTAILWDSQSGEEIWRWEHEGRLIFQAAISPDGRYALTGGDDGVASLWDIQSGALARRFTQSEWIAGLAFAPDGKTLATTSFDGTACLWEVEPRLAQEEFSLPGASLNYMAFSPDGNSLLAAADDNQAHWWDKRTGQKIAEFGGHDQPVYNVDFSADGSRILTAEEIIQVWDAATLERLSRFEMPGPYFFTALAPDGKTALVNTADFQSYLFDALSGEILHQFPAGGYSQSVAYAYDGQRIALGRGVNTSAKVQVLSFPALEDLLLLPFGNDTAVLDIDFSRDGKTLLAAAGGGENAIRLWDLATGELLQDFSGHTGLTWGVALSPDGRYAAAGGMDAIVHVWDTQSGREVRRLVGHSATIGGLAFSPDGQTIASSSADGTVKLWHLDLDALRAEMCDILLRDLTAAERERYNISDPAPTCPEE